MKVCVAAALVASSVAVVAFAQDRPPTTPAPAPYGGQTSRHSAEEKQHSQETPPVNFKVEFENEAVIA
jgi:hypothetical protein